MIGTKNQPSSAQRRLRLERLESRSLLAGGVLELTLFFEPTFDTPTTGVVDEATSPRPQGFVTSSNTDNQAISRPAQQVPQQNTSREQSRPVQNTADQAPDRLELAFNPPQQLRVDHRPDQDPNFRTPAAVDQAIAALASETTIEVVDEATSPQAQEFSALPVETQSLQTPQTSELRSTQTRRLDAIESSTDSGMIDLSPLDPLTPQLGERSDWELNQGTFPLLERIRDAARNDDRLNNQSAEIDQVMQDWFSGPGGLIAVDSVELPAGPFFLDSDMLNEGLRATVALHRSLGWSPETIAPALSGEAIDAVMQSLNHVAQSVVQPVIQTARPIVSSAVYPSAAAIAATTLAINYRRKHRLPESNLQITDG
jgi:hypothetical protein